MALVLADRVRETTTTTGIGTVTLAGAVTGYQTFSAVGNANTTYYCIAGQGTSEWEVGIGTYTSSGTTLSRDTVLSSSNAGAKVNFSAGTKDVFVTYPSGKSINQDASGNVGFGTTAPTAKIDVASGNLLFSSTGQRITGDMSNATQSSRLAFQSSTVNGNTAVTSLPNGTGAQGAFNAFNNSDPTNAAYSQVRVNATESSLISGITGTGTYLPMTFYTNGTEKLRIAADATGTYTFGGTAPRITGDFSNATAASRVMFQSSTTNGATQLSALPNGTGTQSGLFCYDVSDTTNNSWAAIRAVSGADMRLQSGITGTGTYLPMTFYTGGSERVRIDTSGNVGVGTASPGARLHVATSAAEIARFASSSANGGYQVFYPDNGVTPVYVGSQKAILATGNATDFAIVGTGANNMVFGTNSAERMRIDSSGNVGIGTASTGGYRVAVVGSAVSAVPLYFTTDASNTYSYTPNNYYFGSTGAANVAAVTNNTERMRIDSSGNVGIGTTGAASVKLYIGGTLPSSGTNSYGNFLSATIPSASTGGFYGFYSYPSTQAASFTCGTVVHYIAGWQSTGAGSAVTNQYGFLADSTLTNATNNFGFYGNIAAGTGRWNFYAGGTADNYFAGKVGIGTASPGENLTVSSTPNTKISVIDTSGGGKMILQAQAGTLGVVGSENNIPVAIYVNNSERMRITSSGNIVAGASAALATNATDGFLYVPTCAGTPTGTPTAITGMAPIVVNTTNNKLYFYSGGAWRDAGP